MLERKYQFQFDLTCPFLQSLFGSDTEYAVVDGCVLRIWGALGDSYVGSGQVDTPFSRPEAIHVAGYDRLNRKPSYLSATDAFGLFDTQGYCKTSAPLLGVDYLASLAHSPDIKRFSS